MVVEQVVTILLGTASGVAAVLYAFGPGQASDSGGARVETIYLPSGLTSLSLNEIVPIRSSAVEAPASGVASFPSGSFSFMTAGSSDGSKIASFDAPVLRGGSTGRSLLAGRRMAPSRGPASSRIHPRPAAHRSPKPIRKR